VVVAADAEDVVVAEPRKLIRSFALPDSTTRPSPVATPSH
jgi:hypothetical protein